MTIVIGFHVDTAADFDSCSSPTSNLTQRTAGELSVTQYYWIHGSINFAFIIMDACSKHFHFMLGYFHMYNIIVVQVYYIFCIPICYYRATFTLLQKCQHGIILYPGWC